MIKNIAHLVFNGKLAGKTLGFHRKSQKERRRNGEQLLIPEKKEKYDKTQKK